LYVVHVVIMKGLAFMTVLGGKIVRLIVKYILIEHFTILPDHFHYKRLSGNER